ncbi:hypothetical protein IWW36_002496 [Coemansia brasiliensis]|uniref:CobW/HypB/UreG nucleotide-binding domain-containing protein n=1 Tax=Coemansia brasiliensis TaxID=2650707 RepID=A0A9W8IEP1_9FUNG|nr:hypothetical protein IWW36_002496 [Coemansia brasiliensis]
MTTVANQHRSHTVINSSTIPVTVFTGFLGAGKTTAILNILKRVDPDYNIVLLKNEFGDAETDSALARESHINITEMTNGCLCCVLVGQMKNALEEMKEKYHPDRILIETSGSAFPAPIAWQIREMEPAGFHLDAILTVIDCINFCGYEDTSYTARLQAQYTDLILLNKWEHVSERQLDIVIDYVNELNTDTPKIKVDKDSAVDPEIIFGLDTNLFSLAEKNTADAKQAFPDHHNQEVDLIEISRAWSGSSSQLIDTMSFISLLKQLPKDDVYRVKGIVRLSDTVADEASTLPYSPDITTSEYGILYIVNHAFGRYTFTPLVSHPQNYDEVLVKLVIMGQQLQMYLPQIANGLSAADNEVTTHWAN